MARDYFVFFDVDYTLLRGATGTSFGRELLRSRVIGLDDIAMVGLWSVLYKLGWISEVEIWHKSTERLLGKPEVPIIAACRDAHQRHVRHAFYRDGLRAMNEHRDKGARLALISAGPRYSVLAIAEELRIEHTVTAWANVVDGRVHDLAGVQIPYGPMKRTFAEKFCADYGVDPKDCWAYGDSRSDIEMLGFVGNPVAVNPKRPLRRVAEQKGWPIVRWEHVEPASIS